MDPSGSESAANLASTRAPDICQVPYASRLKYVDPVAQVDRLAVGEGLTLSNRLSLHRHAAAQRRHEKLPVLDRDLRMLGNESWISGDSNCATRRLADDGPLGVEP